MIKLSVVMPTFNESGLGLLPTALAAFAGQNETEVIAVDGGSSDNTLDLLKTGSCRVIHLPDSSRAERLNAGIQASRGEMVLLHHPRSILTANGVRALLAIHDHKVWGGFTHCFDTDHWLLKFTSWYSNRVRLPRGVIYLDHCIFFHRSFNGRIPPVDIFEDTELSYRLKNHFGPPLLLDFPAETSAVRFVKNGVFRQALMNQWLKLGYYLKLSHRTMNRRYEKDLNLNCDIDQ